MEEQTIDLTTKLEALQEQAKELRRRVIEVLGNSTGGHYGGALSAADIFSVLYFDIMRFRPMSRAGPIGTVLSSARRTWRWSTVRLCPWPVSYLTRIYAVHTMRWEAPMPCTAT